MNNYAKVVGWLKTIIFVHVMVLYGVLSMNSFESSVKDKSEIQELKTELQQVPEFCKSQFMKELSKTTKGEKNET